MSEHYEPSGGATAQLMRDLSYGLSNNGWTVIVLTATATDSVGDASNPCSVVRLGEQQRAADAPYEVAAMGQRAKRLYDERFGFERSLLHYDQLLRSIR